MGIKGQPIRGRKKREIVPLPESGWYDVVCNDKKVNSYPLTIEEANKLAKSC